MISIALCLFAFVVCLVAGRRSLVGGLISLLTLGYAYGIVRANLADGVSHFIFDAGLLGFYVGHAGRLLNPESWVSIGRLRAWIIVLIAWPMLVFVLPMQDDLVRVVGLRASILLLPLIVVGAGLRTADLKQFALATAVLNVAGFGLAVAEFVWGVEPFFPYRPGVTDIIYKSNDLVGFAFHRIPSSFTSAHAYGGTMVMTLPLLVGAWAQSRSVATWQRLFLSVAIGASVTGVFMAAARSHTVVLFVQVIVITLYLFTASRSKLMLCGLWIVMLTGVGWVVSNEERLQRFTTLEDTEYVSDRIAGSVNMGLWEIAKDYPLGNGLGGGGTSLPYFLQDRIRSPVVMESEVARILLEQGIPGLVLFGAFVVWVLTRGAGAGPESWRLGRRLAWVSCAAYFSTALLGLGLLTSIPQSCLLLLYCGWIAAPPAARAIDVPGRRTARALYDDRWKGQRLLRRREAQALSARANRTATGQTHESTDAPGARIRTEGHGER